MYGFCAIRRTFPGQPGLPSPGIAIDAGMMTYTPRSGLRIAEVPSLELPRRSGRSHPHAVSGGRRVLRTPVSERRGVRTASPLAQGE